ncbi:MAG: hypothetical protein B6I26_01445 [Desulfobacteraceae bacterium 4572_130]|nr:MAG: hypothetical protein B6I26_01445 [Desulfobacteraceae bacterium 4572_130]
MTKKHAKDYAIKHSGKRINKKAEKIIKQKSKDEKITCKSLHIAAKEIGITPSDAGIQIDLMGLKLIECQLGVFGYLPNGKILKKEIKFSKQVEKIIEKNTQNGKIICKKCWEIAKNLKMKKLDISSIANIKNIKIKNCQLGAY